MTAVEDDSIQRLLQKLVGSPVSGSFAAQVQAVDMEAQLVTAMPLGGSVPVENIQLRANQDQGSDGLLIYPPVNSWVLCSPIAGSATQFYVALYTAHDTVTWQFNKLTLNGGSVGMVNLLPLVEKINALENLLNGLIALYNTHTHIAAGTATAVPNNIEGGSIMPITVRADLEDTKIVH